MSGGYAPATNEGYYTFGNSVAPYGTPLAYPIGDMALPDWGIDHHEWAIARLRGPDNFLAQVHWEYNFNGGTTWTTCKIEQHSSGITLSLWYSST